MCSQFSSFDNVRVLDLMRVAECMKIAAEYHLALAKIKQIDIMMALLVGQEFATKVCTCASWN